MATAQREAVQMSKLIDGLLNLAHTTRTELRKESVNLDKIVAETIGELASDLGQRSVDWQVSPLGVVLADPILLRQVMRNLIGNAVKYTRDRQQARIAVAASRGSPHELVIIVRDNGVGFDPKFAGKLFGVFERLHSRGDFEGSGIGLANVRRIIQRHGGRTWAEGEVGRGATFYFSLPV